MPGNLAKIVIPTGYEDQQKQAETKRTLAKMMLERGLAPQNMASWTQVLGQMAQTWAGKHMEHKADQMDAATNKQILGDYASHLAKFNAATADPKADPKAIIQQFAGDPYVADQAKPYADAFAARLKEAGEGTNFGHQWRLKGDIKPGEFEPNSPTDSVLRGPNNTFVLNPVRATAALQAQGYTPSGAPPTGVASMADPMGVGGAANAQEQPPGAPTAPAPLMAPTGSGEALIRGINGAESNFHDFDRNGQPLTSRAGAKYGMQVMPSTAHDPGFGVRPVANESAAEYDRLGRDYALAMAKRYGGNPAMAAGGYNAGPGRMDHALAAAHGDPRGGWQSQLPSETQKYIPKVISGYNHNVMPPAGVVAGKPYWLINGVPYDNPEGK